jgi:hypothetical protein
MFVFMPMALSGAVVVNEPKVDLTYNDFGAVGYLQAPSARFGAAGDFSLGHSNSDLYRHFSANMQVYDWFNATARYTLVPDVLYSSDASFSGDTEYTDKGIDMKLRLIEESRWLPQVAVGLQDIGGTGLFDGEYIVASKRYGRFDASVGVGFGYLGQRGDLSDKQNDTSDCGRDGSVGGKGGEVDYQRWFTGCKNLFSAVSYQFESLPLTLMAEYDGNDYTRDFPVLRGAKIIEVDSPVNIGATYTYRNFADIKLSYLRGNTLTLGFNLKAPFGQMAPFWSAPAQKHLVGEGDTQALVNELGWYAGLGGVEVYAEPDSLTVVGHSAKFRDDQLMVERVARLGLQYAPNVESIKVVERHSGQRLIEHVVTANRYQQYRNASYLEPQFGDAYQRRSPSDQSYGQNLVKSQAKFRHWWSPSFQQGFGSSEGFFAYAVGVKLGSMYQFTDKLSVSGELYLNLFDNYDKFNYTVPPDGTFVPRVRTLIRQYLTEYPARVNSLQLNYITRLSDNLYASAYGGYLEMMFGGLGGELFYRKANSNWGVGIDVNYVKQRDPNQPFGFYDQAYHVEEGRPFVVQDGTFTGHASFHYKANYKYLPSTYISVSAGKFLAEDVGVMVSVAREFDSGVTIGAFAAKTDMSAEEFGEGSFNKGFFMSIPLDRIFTKPTVRRQPISWVPLTRDGGQMLQRAINLNGITWARAH